MELACAMNDSLFKGRQIQVSANNLAAFLVLLLLVCILGAWVVCDAFKKNTQNTSKNW